MKLRKTLYLSEATWNALETLAVADGRSISAYLDRMFAPRSETVRKATPKRAVITSDDAPADPIVHVPFDGEA